MYAVRGSHTSLWTRIIGVIGPRALFTWLLLWMTLVVFAGGLVEVVSGLEFGFVLLIVTIAVLLGWLLGLLPIHGTVSLLLGLVLGGEFLLLRVGRLGDEIIGIVRSVFSVGGQMLAWLWERALYLTSYSLEDRVFEMELVRTVNWTSIPDAFNILWAGMGTLLSRANSWMASVIAGDGTFDPVGAALIWGLIVWLCALWAGWMVSRRQRPLVAILPSGFLLSFILAYTWSPPGILLPLLGLVLIQMALIHHRARESRWDIAGIDFSRDLWNELAMMTTGVSLGLVLLAAVVPTVSFEKLAQWVEEITAPEEEETQAQQVAESLGLEQKPKPQPVQPVRLAQSTDLPRRHLIGSGAELSRIVVFAVETGELPAIKEQDYLEMELESEVARHYWRSLTYDRYFSRGWSTTSAEQATYEAGEFFVDPETAENQRVLRQKVRVIGELGGLVHVDGNLVSMDTSFEVTWRPPNEIFAVTTEEISYTADSLLPVYTVEELRAASTEYPEWLLERYLQLPETVPERVYALARDLTATEPTPFDRALAIESYLREFPYTLDVPKPTAQDDIADYFLFELQEGYCDYYATAMVVLARAAGLPARLVVGYASGRYDFGNARYIVTEADAHAWVDVYFPGYGWIEFEPTGGRPAIDRPQEEEPFIWPDESQLPPLAINPPVETSEPMRIVFGTWMIAGVGAIALIIFGITGIDSALLLLRRSPQGMATTLYERLRKYAQRLAVPQRVGDTPYELGTAFVQRMLAIADDHNDGDLLPPAEDEIPVLIELYVKAWYAPYPIETTERRTAVWAWWKLHWRLILARLWRKRRKERPEMPGNPPVVRSTVPPPTMAH